MKLDPDKKQKSSAFDLLQSEATTFQSIGEFKKAIKSFTKALDVKPGDKNCLVSRGRCYLKIGDPERALNDSNDIQTNDPQYVKSLLIKADALHEMMQFEYALMFYHRGLRLRPEIHEFKQGVQRAQEAIENSIGERSGIVLDTSGDLTYFSYDLDMQVNNNNNNNNKNNNNNFKSMCNPKTCKQLLGELYADREFLENLLNKTGITVCYSEANVMIRSLTLQGLDFLDTRTDFWLQQKPLSTKKINYNNNNNNKNNMNNNKYNNNNGYVDWRNELVSVEDLQIKGEYKESIKRIAQLFAILSKPTMRETPDRMELFATLHGYLGTAYSNTNQFDRALKEFNKELKIAKKNDLTNCKMDGLDNIGRIYVKWKKYDDAIKCFKKLSKISDSTEKIWLYHEIGRCYLEKEAKNEMAGKYGKKSLRLARYELDDVWTLNAMVLIGESFENRQRYKNALKSYQGALTTAENLNDVIAEEALAKKIKDIKDKITIDGDNDDEEEEPEEEKDDDDDDDDDDSDDGVGSCESITSGLLSLVYLVFFLIIIDDDFQFH
ncbi:hypothetical protein HELRODRAFT_90920 [Helobdella robusta]|uniref:Outer dynein arm-docking complex subunit 4 n=1 Tax=Helobdella robusta TaxID=6412 RepID=T1G7Y0_HELRO|nr:hypothetical protein HELRODRAFT_90920 [Helobdella robusta]ESN90138.1 hypothetical protein HELRODRAFT_90920 [Helobdella robusta]